MPIYCALRATPTRNLLLSMGVWLLTQVAFAQEITRPIGTVCFNPVDVFGKSLPYHVVSFVPSGSHQEYADLFSGLCGKNIPYGDYSYRLWRSDLPRIGQFEGRISVDQGEVLRTLVYSGMFRIVRGRAIEPLLASPPGYLIRGTVTPPPLSQEPMWVRLQSLYGQSSYEAHIDEKGNFGIARFLRGNYVLLVIQEERLLYSGYISFRGGSVNPGLLSIDLTKGTPSVTIVP